MVDSKRRESGYRETQVGYGIALREVLQDGIEALKPEKGLLDPLEKSWRSYQILIGSFIHGRSPEYLAGEMGIARNTYNHEQASALDRLLALIAEWEELAAKQGSGDSVEAETIIIPLTVPPRPPHGLIGRENLLFELTAQLKSFDRLTLYGIPGVGKTAIAIEIGHAMEGYFSNGVLWTSLGPTPDVGVQFRLWELTMGLHASEIRELPDLKSRASKLHSLIGDKQILMIVDDVWDEASACSFEIGGANCCYLFTTRFPRIAASLAGEFSISVPELGEDDSLSLLERFVPRPKQALKERWRELVQAVGGLP